ncbi:MAG: hypothetical protein ABW321_00305 [Polyangiales bacterium]
MTHKPKVLLIGLDPSVVDFASLPMKLDEPTLRAALAADLQRLIDLGYDAAWLLTDRGETAVSVVSARLAAERFDCVLVGAGIRLLEPMFGLFEQLVNAIHAGAPNAKIAFNTNPKDTAEAVQRWV